MSSWVNGDGIYWPCSEKNIICDPPLYNATIIMISCREKKRQQQSCLLLAAIGEELQERDREVERVSADGTFSILHFLLLLLYCLCFSH